MPVPPNSGAGGVAATEASGGGESDDLVALAKGLEVLAKKLPSGEATEADRALLKSQASGILRTVEGPAPEGAVRLRFHG